jgi:hypothetical protein
MIFFFESGKLGNQLFQYFGLKKYFPNQKLIFFGCDDLKKICYNLNILFFSNKQNTKFLFSILNFFFSFLVKIRIIGSITQFAKNDDFRIVIKRGVLFNIYLARSIYFQHHVCTKVLINTTILKKRFLNSGEKWLKQKGVFSNQHRLTFVNIRRGDYIYGPFCKFPSVLDLDWYKKSMSYISKKVHKPIFIVMGDDHYYIRDFFKETNSLFISNNSAEIDLSIMSMCSHGILSASSLAWWGALFSKNSKKNNFCSYFVAPKFWMGHRLKKWYPQGFFSNWITYLK